MRKGSAETGGQARRYLGAGWRFTRHLLEMGVAMIAGMAVLGVLGELPGYDNPLVEYSLTGAFMSAPMAAWMRHRGYSWSDGLEMTVAMLALVRPVELGVARFVPAPFAGGNARLSTGAGASTCHNTQCISASGLRARIGRRTL